MKDEHQPFNVQNAFAHCATYETYLKIDTTELSCRNCLEKFDRIDVIAHHFNDKHDAKINFDFQLGVHPFKFLQDKLMCGNCDLNFPCMRQLSRHISSHSQNYNCDSCGKSYTTSNSLKQHQRFSHIPDERICRKCKKTFSTLQEKKYHTVNSPKCWIYQCRNCGERFLTWKNKEEHLVEAHGESKKSYSCPECSMSFPTRSIYRTHFNTTHAEVKFPCTYCGRKFSAKRYLDQHILVHTGDKAFQCNVCSKSFPRKKNLSQHMWIHNESKRFECKPCQRQFNQRFSYKSHMKAHHPDIPEDDWYK
ncbi:hypothetical protein HF086_009522 [Spodoptera exigua]|uniref:C2H2-type domain-containing protein n=1 Tax=Spodoptera exigua TaxID=7107 RepID=A0A922MF57_SPOEX|nr:hypothetical protein HF086_009522 [Spodoptera exigua]